MNAWAGIESAPEMPQKRTAEGAAGVAEPTRVQPQRRIRRQTRPVLGSIDLAGVILQRHARVIVLGSAAILLPGVALNVVAAGLAFDRYQDLSGSLASGPELLGAGRAATGVESLLWYLAAVITSLAATLVGGYVATGAAQRQLGRPVSATQGYRGLLTRFPALVIAWLIGHSWFVLGAWLLGHSAGWSAGLLILASPIAVLLVVATTLVAPAIVIEQIGPFAALRRSWRLARGRFGLMVAFVTASSIVGVFVQYGITILPRALDAVGLLSFGRFAWIAQGVAAQLGRLISMPLVAVATALVYLEIRMDAEGMDLIIDAERSFGAGTGP